MATFGKTDVGGTEWQTEADKQRGCKFTLSEDGNVSKITVYMKTYYENQKTKCAIYTDNAGSPNVLKAASVEVLVGTSFSWVDFTITGGVSLNAGVYWLFMWSENYNTIVYDAGDVGQFKRATNAYDGWQDPFGSVDETQSRAMSIYATYTPSAAAAPLGNITVLAQQMGLI